MATINNADLTRELIEGAKIQLSFDDVPGRLAQAVVPTMEVNPKMFRKINVVAHGERTATGPVIAYSTPTDRDFYLSLLQLSHTADVLSDSARVRIEFTTDGQTRRIDFKKQALKINDINGVIPFAIPIKLDRGTNIVLNLSFAAGDEAAHLSIFGYTVDE